MSDVTPEKAQALLDGATPGPWGYDDSLCIFGGQPPKGAMHQWKNTVCQVPMTDTVTGLLTKTERDANARLIAAAPDLARTVIAQAAELAERDATIGTLKAIIRVNGLRAGATHAEIDAVINGDINVG